MRLIQLTSLVLGAIVLSTSFSKPTMALGVKESFLKAIKAKDVWIPSATALAFGLSKYDGRISDYASRERPLFGSIQNAKDYSDRLAFNYFPIASLITTVGATYSQEMTPIQRKYFTYFNIISGPALTYLFNNIVKNRSGRLRPDASNRESFPSSHTAIASAFSENISLHSHALFGQYSSSYNIFNESLVGVVGWARMESKKHHFSDVLVGYSIGKFFTKFFHYWLVEQDSNSKISFSYQPNQHIQGNFSWDF